MLLNPFDGKNIVITGGSKGIGLEMAKEFARLGANVALIARDKEVLDAAKREVEQCGSLIRVLAYSCDVTDPDTLGDYINMVRYEFGSIDGVVANSGYCHPGKFHEIELADFDRQIEVNLKGVIYTIHHAMPHLLDKGAGFIAITSSPAGNAGIFGFSAYGPTKAALNNLSYALRQEYADRNIRVHLLLPPDTDTEGYALEVPMYPPETKAILGGGSLLGPGPVAKKFVRGIANNRKVIAIGFETRFMIASLRIAPFIWEGYVRRKIRAARKAQSSAEKREETQSVNSESVDS